ncbi:MAG: CDP-diacylglycerol--serine O-phosphatidyltransferase [Bacteroidetes bacterium]|nr:CDP-diacylglycerol--serine O-phosphatidyltransferase [Bacteroidota bacterium]
MHIRKHIPNAITCLNLLSGCIGILLALHKNQVAWAAVMIGFASFFDFFDGLAARILHVKSDIGKELDSLADMVSFGVLPGVLVYVMLATISTNSFVPLVGFIIPVFSALRLAKFNLDTRQTESFLGLPVPAHAIFWVGVTLLDFTITNNSANLMMQQAFKQPFVVIIFTIMLSLLLVSELPMFSLKFKNLYWAGNEIRYGFLGSAVFLTALLGVGALPVTILLYVLISIIAKLRSNNKVG